MSSGKETTLLLISVWAQDIFTKGFLAEAKENVSTSSVYTNLYIDYMRTERMKSSKEFKWNYILSHNYAVVIINFYILGVVKSP